MKLAMIRLVKSQVCLWLTALQSRPHSFQDQKQLKLLLTAL